MEGRRFAAFLILTICLLAPVAGASERGGPPTDECSRSVALRKCYLPRDPGLRCKASIRMYYFNRYFNTCETFKYGGCQGNNNRFVTMEDCLGCCQLSKCEQPAETGPCKASLRKYYFDVDWNDCKPFIYGGCGGNDNNFLTYDECYDKCGSK